MLGVFDSGVGGLHVLRAIHERFPTLDITYLGDSARTPYGDRDRETVTEYTKECCSFLFDRGCTLIVLACNTASAETLREIQRDWLPSLSFPDNRSRNIIGVIRPLAEEAIEYTTSNRIAVVGTRSTISSNTYKDELMKLKKTVLVIQRACPLLVPLIEEGYIDAPETRKILRGYLRNLKTQNPDVLILGCTHYEALHQLFTQMMGKRCAVLHSSAIISDKFADYIGRHPEFDLPKKSSMSFLTTGDPERFIEIGSRFYGASIPYTERVSVHSAGVRK